MTAGDKSTQIVNEGGGTFNIGTPITITEIRTIALDVAKSVFVDSIMFARELIDARTENITDEVIRKITEKDPNLYHRFKDPRFLSSLLSIQRSFAETGDEELGGILSGLLADLAAEPIRSRREIVLRQAMECAPRLTTKHLNALSVLLRIERIRYPFDRTVAIFISSLAGDLAPYFNAIPDDSFDYEYMGSTEAGTYLRMTSSNIFERVYYVNRNALYDPFTIEQYLDYLEKRALDINELKTCLNDVSRLLKIVPDDPQKRIKLDWADGERILSYGSEGTHTITLGEQYLQEFLLSISVSISKFEGAIREQQPELGEFLDTLQSSHAFNFQLSPVGIMLARHEIESRSPETAAQLDSLFDD
ncbi:LPO_1073/Vpar_1526 family protein [Mycolicibacterium fluoranthenivorans]|uniref:Uncharacterized protein n=1 Tax=Mycolicibacterium fluoranthenivorans TaxID=258505 RepID=A0A1G4X047_9MYCO|nr:hypothetical protein SAMN02799620_05879 [Mycolicibacterium fluoranthenivorans]